MWDFDYLDTKIIELTLKYPFLPDPIVLFKPDWGIQSSHIDSWILNLNYPFLQSAKSKVQEAKNDLHSIFEILIQTDFESEFLRYQYDKRLNDFSDILKIIENFNNEDESRQFELINSIFGVDIQLFDEIIANEKKVYNEFENYCSHRDIQTVKMIEWLKDKQFDAKQIKHYFEESLKYLWILDKWNVRITDDVIVIMHTNFNNWWWEVLIPDGKIINLERLLALIIHELDWHCKQFTNNNCGIFKGSIRFSHSEEFIEWLALYLQYWLSKLLFGKNDVVDRFYKDWLKISFLKWEISHKELIDKFNWPNNIRLFRWFKNIKRFINTKDLVYLQWLYKLIKYKDTYSNFFELIYDWAINEEYIKQYWNIWKGSFNLEEFVYNSSAFYVLKQIWWV